jgi:hypothetical protein
MCDNRACDLCGLDIGNQPFYLERGARRLQFCCEGCQGIWQMLHEDDPPPAPNPPNPGREPS